MQPIGVNVNVNFLACLVLFLASRPKRREIFAAAVLGATLGVYLGLQGSVLQKILQALSYCGAGALPTVWMMPLLSRRSDLKLLVKLLFPPAFGIVTSLFLNLGSHGVTYDRFLYAFDGSLGFQPSFWAGRMVSEAPWISQFTRALYEALPLFLVTAYLIEERRGAAHARRLFLFILVVGLSGAACFFLFPAVGAYWIFAKTFPFHAPAVSTLPLIPTLISTPVPRNCMPSLHTSWALIVIWAAGRCTLPWRLTLRGLLAVMLLQTLVFHYLADMVVAVPFTLSVYAILQTDVPWSAPQRRGALGFGVITVAAWLVALRWGIPVFEVSPLVPWGAAVLTVGAGWWLWRGLDRAAAPTVEQTVAMPDQAALVAALPHQ